MNRNGHATLYIVNDRLETTKSNASSLVKEKSLT